MNKNKFLFFLSALGMIIFLWQCKHLPTEEVLPSSPNHSAPNPPYVPPPDTVCFSSDILPLVISTCAKPGCHDATTQLKGYNFTNYNNIKSYLNNKSPFNSSEGLYRLISGASVSKIAEMHVVFPSSASLVPLNDSASLAKINKWLNQGSINSVCTSCDTVNVKFNTHIKPLVQSNCAGCHTYTSGTLLTNYAQIKTSVDNGKLYNVITHTTGFQAMPQGGSKLSDCKIRMLKIWIDSGAPNN